MILSQGRVKTLSSRAGRPLDRGVRLSRHIPPVNAEAGRPRIEAAPDHLIQQLAQHIAQANRIAFIQRMTGGRFRAPFFIGGGGTPEDTGILLRLAPETGLGEICFDSPRAALRLLTRIGGLC
jgi:hypothetical protein